MPIVSIAELKSIKLDYIIIGGGTAGLTVASRLSEIPTNTVLVIEAGSEHGSVPEIDIPGFLGRTIANPKYDWNFMSVPQKHANNNVILQPRGKGLGGSSFMNFLCYSRPSKPEFDALEELGNDGWNWKSLLYYMKKSEKTSFPSDLTPEKARLYAVVPEPDAHGVNGPIQKCMRTEWSDAHAKLFDAAASLGIPRGLETGNGANTGSMSPFSTVDPRTATRSYSYTAYLKPYIQRNNLLVVTDTQVTKVLFDSDNGQLRKAVGVEVVKDAKIYHVDGVQKEVIISAGSLQTPHILELSGIGNPEILAGFNIECHVDLPGVGENLQDHIAVYTIAEVDATHETFDALAEPELLKKHEELYKEQRGHLAWGLVPAFIFLSAKQVASDEDVASWQSQARTWITESLARTIPSLKAGLEKQYTIQEKFMADIDQAQAEIILFLGHPSVANSAPVPGKRYIGLACALMHPLSRGSVHIASVDPLAAPAIDPNYFANEADLDFLAHIIQLAHRLYRTPPLSNIVKSEVLPPADIVEDKDKLREYIKDQNQPIYHPLGTAAMLPREDGGVVDNQLRVYGTSNLRVADLSVMPLELSCHTQSVAYAIGEKAADIILKS